MLPDERRNLICLSLSVLALLAGPSRLFAARWENGHDPRLAAAPALPDTGRRGEQPVFVPWPGSLRLLAVVDGEMPGDPLPPVDCGDGVVLEPAHGPDLVERTLKALNRDLALLEQLRELALQASRPVSAEDRAELERVFRAGLKEIDRLARDTRIDGYPLLADHAVEICLDHIGIEVPVTDMTTPGLGLSGSGFGLTTISHASTSVASIDTALFSVTSHRQTMLRFDQALQDGPEQGGLREQQDVLERMRNLAQQAVDETLNTVDRHLLDIPFQADLERIAGVADQVKLRGRRLLDGSLSARLQGAPPLSNLVDYELPDTRPGALGLAGLDLVQLCDASSALEAVDAALSTIAAHRDELAAVRDDLDGLRAPRRNAR